MTRSFYITIFSRSILKYSFKTSQVYMSVCVPLVPVEEKTSTAKSFSQSEHELAPLVRLTGSPEQASVGPGNWTLFLWKSSRFLNYHHLSTTLTLSHNLRLSLTLGYILKSGRPRIHSLPEYLHFLLFFFNANITKLILETIHSQLGLH